MTTINSQEVIAESLQRIDKVFRGSFVIRGNSVLQWTLYFRLGRLSWVTGGLNFRERLQRHLAIYCPQITSKVLKQIPLEHQPHREQQILVHLQGKGFITRSHMTILMENIAVEVIFDAIQYGETETDSLSCHKIAAAKNNNLLLLLPVLDINVVLTRARQEWERWKNASLEEYSPNLYPIIKQPNLLKKLVEDNKQQKIINSINGSRTLRGIATKSQQNIIEITLFLQSLTDSGAIIFSSLPDIQKVRSSKAQPYSIKKTTALSINLSSNQKNIPQPPPKKQDNSQAKQPYLIVCIDDSPLVCKTVKDIVVEQKYRFLEIQEPIKVIPILLRNKPDLIFLDLMMPIVNGYELCSQMRKTSSLKDVPIVILTGKDGLVDRMRAKLVGSTDFVAKPVKTFPILQMIDKYITVNQ